MNHSFIRIALILCGLLLLTAGAPAATIGGYTLALSPDGGTLIAAGGGRTFYRLDPETLEVQERVWNGLSVTRMAFSQDGSVLAVADAGMGGIVTLFDAATLRRNTDVRRCDPVAFSTAANLFAGVEGNRSDAARLNVYSLADGERLLQVALQPRLPVAAVALDLDGQMVAVLYDGQTDPAEERTTPDPALRGLERLVAQQMGDGKTSRVEFFSIPSGDRVAEQAVYFSTSGSSQAVLRNGAMVVVNYGNQNAVLGQDGSVELFQCANSFNYGIGFTTDHETVMTGGLAQMALTSLADRVSRDFPVRERLPSWPEYFRGFAGNSEGMLFGSTDGHRVLAIRRNASVALEKPVY